MTQENKIRVHLEEVIQLRRKSKGRILRQEQGWPLEVLMQRSETIRLALLDDQLDCWFRTDRTKEKDENRKISLVKSNIITGNEVGLIHTKQEICNSLTPFL